MVVQACRLAAPEAAASDGVENTPVPQPKGCPSTDGWFALGGGRLAPGLFFAAIKTSIQKHILVIGWAGGVC